MVDKRKRTSEETSTNNRTIQNTQREKGRKALKTAWKKWPLACVLLLAVGALLITASEYFKGPLPTWTEVYDDAGLSRMEGIPQEARDAKTKIHFIDVGQGAATLIESDGVFCLIDAGLAGTEEDLVGYLRDAGVKTLDLLVMTHPHADHIGGMVAVLEAFEVEEVLLPELSKAPPVETYTALRTLELIDTQGIPDTVARVGDTYAIGEGTMTVLDTGVETKDYNEISVITLFEAPGIRFLTGGDAEQSQMDVMLENDIAPEVDLYAASHHGSADANRRAWVSSLSPRFVAISCGKNNSYGHPHAESLQNFAEVGAEIWRTDEQGNLVAYVDETGALRMTATYDETLANAA